MNNGQMNNGQIMRIYPEMQEKRLLDLIHNVTPELEQLKLLKEQHTILSRISERARNGIIRDFNYIIRDYKNYKKILSTPELKHSVEKMQKLEESKKQLNTTVGSLIRDVDTRLNDSINFRKISLNIYDENRGTYISKDQIIEQQKIEIKTIFDKLIESNPEQSNLLKFVSDQESNPIKEIVKVGELMHDGYLDINLDLCFFKTKILKFIYTMEIEEQVKSKFNNAIKLKFNKLATLRYKLKKLKDEDKIYDNQLRKQHPQTIAPNIVIQKLYPYDPLENCYYLEYHINDKSLFLNKFKIKDSNNKLGLCECTDFERAKIEYLLIDNIPEFYNCIKEFKKSTQKGIPLVNVCHMFFEEKHIKQVLLNSGLVDDPDNVIIGINNNFITSTLGFAVIKTIKDKKPLNKIMFFQDVVDKNGKPYLHVVECGELLHNNHKVMFENNKIKSLLEDLNCDLFSLLFRYKGDNKKPTDIIKSGEIFKPIEPKIDPDGSKIAPYDENLEMKHKPSDIRLFHIVNHIGNQVVQHPDDNIVKKYIERFINTQNMLRNIHAVGSPTNTLLTLPYYCVDGVKIANNLPLTSETNSDTAAPKIANLEDKEAINKLSKANREAINKFIDRSLNL